ncbi:phosphate transport system regulatory protein PhoU [Lysinibacillus yapensis]|uniref:Phosphate-specific transport system accessory protein PhoU n=1 Tax=Ureibacillus yapensis TaxID=2304605 RepID=A0A396S584_9BACL|nr:phosphate signaling complex protein PhoU [Lysinibacillus yapensis]RHW34674.1 phosphate transport system regulatory protein PhoU [Lysinibacillus yapensis]
MVIRENFENSLQELKKKISDMGELSIQALENAFIALKTQDVEIALSVIEEDTEVDDLDDEINQFAVWLISKEQPVARDLREIIGALKISSEIERVADFAVNISKATIKIGKSKSLLELTHLEKMKDVSVQMLQKALQSFLEANIVMAKEVSDLEDQVDEYNSETYKTLTNYLREHPEDMDQLLQLIFINRHLERAADHITNIAESTAYLIKGKIYDFNS